MSLIISLKLLLVLSFIGLVAADTGDDFINNLFSDLAPLLALFGERVTMQFMSQSMGWADHVILAMAPLGIITAIVSAIRVGGPSLLKAVIGRARENLAVAEAELMSSTSHEVCELWNGKEVVRCMGEAKICEFICLYPAAQQNSQKDNQTHESDRVPNFKTMKLDAAETRTYLDKVEPSFKKDLIESYQHLGKALSQGCKRLKCNLFQRCGRKCGCLGDEEQNPVFRNETNQTSTSTQTSTPQETSTPPKKKEIIVIRNNSGSPPNISLNSHTQSGRGELRLFAFVGTILQLGVLIFSGFITYYPTLKWKKNDKTISPYAYPSMATGTITLMAGIMLCSHVVESSTKEDSYRPKHAWEARMVWLQKKQTVNDQSFESVAIYPQKTLTLITTSRRAINEAMRWGPGNKVAAAQGSENEKSRTCRFAKFFKPLGKVLGLLRMDGKEFTDDEKRIILEAKTCIATLISLCGFILQFTGLRGMHFSASIAQLVAISLMTAVRAFVRRGLAEPPLSFGIPSEFELEWFTTMLCSPREAPWDKSSSPDSKNGSSSENSTKDWRIMTGGNQTYKELVVTTPPENSQSNDTSSSDGHKMMVLRNRLGWLTSWHGRPAKEARQLAKAIGVTMDALFGNHSAVTWHLPAMVSHRDPKTQYITLQLELRNGKWEARLEDIETALSLWLYSADKKEKKMEKEKEEQKENPAHRKHFSADGGYSWMDTLYSRARRSLRLLGPDEPELRRDLLWWVPPDMRRVIAVKEDTDGTVEVIHDRIVGTASQSQDTETSKYTIQEMEDPFRAQNDKSAQDNTSAQGNPSAQDKTSAEDNTSLQDNESAEDNESSKKGENALGSLAAESYSSLETVFAQDMFASFIRSAAMALEEPIEGEAEIMRSNETLNNESWKDFTLRNTGLSKLIQNIQAAGLGTLDEIYLSIIPGLSSEKKLPPVDAIIELADEHARRHEERQNWDAVGDVYSWLFQRAVTFGKYPRSAHNHIARKATAILLECLRFVSQTIEERENQLYNKRDVDGLKNLKSRVEGELSRADDEMCGIIFSLYQEQSRSWSCDIIKLIPSMNDDRWFQSVSFTKLHQKIPNAGSWEARELLREGIDPNSKDVQNWTPLHYAAIMESGRGDAVVEAILDAKIEVNAKDLRGWTPLHYACKHSRTRAEQLIREGFDVNMRSRDGVSPLIYAAKTGNAESIRSLIEAGATVDLPDGRGSTPLHWAAFYGRLKIVENIWEVSNKMIRDYNGRTALHLAALGGRLDIIKWIVEDQGRDKNPKDRAGRTPLHLSSAKGQTDIVRLFLDEYGADKDVRDGYQKTPLHLAAEEGQTIIVRLLLDKYGADKEARDQLERTPLALTIRFGYTDIVKLLLEYGADKEAQDQIQSTPLHLAAEKGQTDIVRLLLEYGADKEAQDVLLRTPLYLATEEGRTDIISILEA